MESSLCMYEITIHHKTGKKVYPVYTEEEAEKEGVKYVYWKNAEEGEYGCSDDGKISRCYSRKKINPRNDEYIRFGMGATWVNSPQLVIKGRENIHNSSGERAMVQWMRKKKIKDITGLAARNVPISEAIQTVIQPKNKSDWDKWFRITKSREFKNKVSEEREAILQEAGITDDALAEAWMKLKADAEALDDEKEQLKLRRGILQDLSSFKGWGKEDRVKLKHEQIEGVFDTKLLGEIMQLKGESKEVEATTEQLKQSTRPEKS